MKKEYIKPTMLTVRILTSCRMLAVSQPDDIPWWDGECDVHEFRGDFGNVPGRSSIWDEEW